MISRGRCHAFAKSPGGGDQGLHVWRGGVHVTVVVVIVIVAVTFIIFLCNKASKISFKLKTKYKKNIPSLLFDSVGCHRKFPSCSIYFHFFHGRTRKLWMPSVSAQV